MKSPRFTIVLKGSAKDKGKLRLDEFINSLEVIVDALKDAEKRISGKTRAMIHYKIVHLSQNSPARITIEPILETKYENEISIGQPFNDVMHNLRFIKTKKTVPEDMEYHDAE